MSGHAEAGASSGSLGLTNVEASPKMGRDLLRFLTCGSVDDGKSTLIGRLLLDAGMLTEDQLAHARADSTKHGTVGDETDLALIVDGLMAEREQGITIDVAYRYFATPRRKFIVADTPGHEQYTRNMATGASVSDLAVVLVDARKGVLTQTRRHCFIAQLLGIREVVLAVNKMDLIGFSRQRFEEVDRDCRTFAEQLGLDRLLAVPIVARSGDNVVHQSERMPWYQGPTLLAHLETVEAPRVSVERAFRMPVQWVNRPNGDFRGYAGTIASGKITPGKTIVALPSGRVTSVRHIMRGDALLEEAAAGNAVTISLADEIDIGRGDVLSAIDDRPEISDQIGADVIWMGEEPLLPGRQYLIKCGAQTVSATVTALKHKIGLEHLEKNATQSLSLNEIGFCNFSFARPIVFETYAANRRMGGFIIIDKANSATVGAGLIRFGLRRAQNVKRQVFDIDKVARAALKGQRPFCVWLTGLSGAGKSTLANLLEKRLHAAGRHTYVLDGDNIRHGLNRDLGFSDVDRIASIRRVAEVAGLMVDAGLIVIVALISPFRGERQAARQLFAEGEFIEVFVDTPLAICEQRDPRGLYRKARAGLLPHFTGLDSIYEAPERPEIHLKGGEELPAQLVDHILQKLPQSA